MPYKNIKINSSSDFFLLLLGRVDFDIYQNLAMLLFIRLRHVKKYFGDACDLRSQEGCDKYRELNQKQETHK